MPFWRRGGGKDKLTGLEPSDTGLADTPSFDYEGEMRKAQRVANLMDENRAGERAIHLPEDAPKSLEVYAAVATTMVELVGDKAGDEAAAELARGASAKLNNERFYPAEIPKGTVELVERFLSGIGKAMEKSKGGSLVKPDEADPDEAVGVCVARTPEELKGVQNAAGLITFLDGYSPDPSAGALTIGHEVAELGDKLRTGREESRVVLLGSGLLDTAIRVKATRPDYGGTGQAGGSRNLIYEFSIISTLDDIDRQRQRGLAAENKTHSQRYVEGSRAGADAQRDDERAQQEARAAIEKANESPL